MCRVLVFFGRKLETAVEFAVIYSKSDNTYLHLAILRCCVTVYERHNRVLLLQGKLCRITMYRVMSCFIWKLLFNMLVSNNIFSDSSAV